LQTEAASLHGHRRERAYEHLRDDILAGRYRNGESLTEARICQDLGVSRTPVREAFCQLELDGLVRMIPNKGAVVTGFGTHDMDDMFQIRMMVEGIAVRRAAEAMTDSELELLEAALLEEEEMTRRGDTEALQRVDSRFHEILFRGSGSRVLQTLLSALHLHSRQARSLSLSSGTRARESLEEHRRILEALKRRDPVLAQQEMERHVGNAAANYHRSTQNGGNEG